ncbi:hypothetical protein BS17DRAFT_716225, partial [Gyrodon lividus]
IFQHAIQRLHQEIIVWLGLKHTNVIPLYGMTMGFGQFPAMVYPWLENNLCSCNISCLIVHSRSIVHDNLSGVCDLICIDLILTYMSNVQVNVLIHNNGRACIADFGLSMLLTELGASTFTTSFQARGTLHWAAPELLDLQMIENAPKVVLTLQSDVYSFGGITLQVCYTNALFCSHVLMYLDDQHILTGNVPYHDYAHEAQVIHAISKGSTPTCLSQEVVTDCQWKFIQQCWTSIDAG